MKRAPDIRRERTISSPHANSFESYHSGGIGTPQIAAPGPRKVQVSYSQLILDHDRIEASAATLLIDIVDEALSSTDLAIQLGDLARAVNEHIDVEDRILARVGSENLSAPWNNVWRDGEAAFLRLRADWIMFIERWNSSTIQTDRLAFNVDANAILGRLRDRLAIETKAFYATALQTGGITLR